jgi:hypothetical protein
VQDGDFGVAHLCRTHELSNQATLANAGGAKHRDQPGADVAGDLFEEALERGQIGVTADHAGIEPGHSAFSYRLGSEQAAGCDRALLSL